MTNQPHRIDVHHHILPDFYVKAVQAAGIADAGDVAFPKWSVESTLALMDRAGIATAITSIAAPGVHFGDAAAARALARRCNEYSARLVADRPDRFGAFAVLPLPDVDGALEEVAYALDTLHLEGVVVLASIGPRYLGDPAFDAVFDELNRRKAVVFVHPTVPVSSRSIEIAIPGALMEFVFDTTRAAANLIFSGTMERCPELKIILSHSGGTAPYLASRWELARLSPQLHAKAPRGATAYLQRFYYDTALTAAPSTWGSLREVALPSNILFGSDHPFLPEPLVEESVRALAATTMFDRATRAAIERTNSLELFPRLQVAKAA